MALVPGLGKRPDRSAEVLPDARQGRRIRKYDADGITFLGGGADGFFVDPDEGPRGEHYKLDGQPPKAKGGSWVKTYKEAIGD